MALQPTQGSPGPSSPSTIIGVDKGKKPANQNRSWVRGRDPEPLEDSPDGSDNGRRSLLSRLESPSLLKRIAHPEDATSPTKLALRLKTPPAPIRISREHDSYDEDIDMREEAPPLRPPLDEIRVKTEEPIATIPSPTAERRGRTRGRPTIDVFGEPTTPTSSSSSQDPFDDSNNPDDPVEEGDHSPTPTPQPIPVSESVVDALLADILPANTSLAAPSTCISQTPHSSSVLDQDVDMSPRRSVSTQPLPQRSSSLSSAVLAQCRQLLLPSMINFARRRNPTLDEETARNRVLARLTDDRMAEFVALAKKMQTELQAQGTMSQARMMAILSGEPSSTEKRRRDDDEDEDRPLKLPRTESPGDIDVDEVGVPHASVEGGPSMQNAVRDPEPVPQEGNSPAMAVAGVAAVPGSPSRARSDTPMSLTALPSSSTPRPTRQPSLLPHLPSEGQQLPTSASTSLVNSELRSPASADTSLLSTTTPHPALPSAASVLPYAHSPSPAASVPALAGTRDAFTPDHPDTSHHEPVTSLPVTTSDTDAQDIPKSPIQDAMPAQTREQIPEAEQEPEGKTLVPAIWWAFEGKHHPSMQKIQFFVDDATADAAERWASRKESFSFEGKHVRVTVLCLPTATVSEVYQNLPPDASRADIVSALWNIKSEWPPLGTLIVQTPYERPIHMWVPPQHTGALDITHAIVRGENKFKLIQLADMSGKLFVFHASEPSDDEQLAIGTETMGWSRARTKLAPSSPRSSHFGSP